MSQPTLWGHASRVPGRGWRGWLRPLRSPGRPRSGRPWRARGRQVARIGGNLNHLGAVSGLVERRRRPHWDDLPSHLAGEKPRPAAGFVDTPRSQRRLMAFPLGIAGGERPPAEGGMGVHMPTLRDADRGIESGGSLPTPAASSGSASPLRRPWCNRKAATYGSAGTHMEAASSCTCTPMSDVHRVAGSYPATPKGLTGIVSLIPAI